LAQVGGRPKHAHERPRPATAGTACSTIEQWQRHNTKDVDRSTPGKKEPIIPVDYDPTASRPARTPPTPVAGHQDLATRGHERLPIAGDSDEQSRSSLAEMASAGRNGTAFTIAKQSVIAVAESEIQHNKRRRRPRRIRVRRSIEGQSSAVADVARQWHGTTWGCTCEHAHLRFFSNNLLTLRQKV
jgi:hypothetical protein